MILRGHYTLTFEEAQEELRKSGVKTTEVYQQQIAVINALIEAHQGDQVVTAQLAEQKEVLVEQITQLNAVQRRGGRSTRAYSFAVLSLSQGLGDAAQFQHGLARGAQAVGNNVEATAQAFSMAYAKGNGFRGMLRGVGSALMGPAGVVAGISLLSLGVQLLASRAEAATKELSTLQKAAEATFKIKGVTDSIEITPTNAPLYIDEAIAGRRDLIKEAFEARGGDFERYVRNRPSALEGLTKQFEAGRLGTDEQRKSYEAFGATLEVLNNIQSQFIANQQIIDAARSRGIKTVEDENRLLREQASLLDQGLKLQLRRAKQLSSFSQIEAERRQVPRGGLAGILGRMKWS